MVYGFFTVRHALWLRRRIAEKDPDTVALTNGSTVYNELLLAGLFFSSGLLWPFVYLPTGASVAGINLLYWVSTLIIVGIGCVWYVQGTFNYIRCRLDPVEKQKRLDEEREITNYYLHDFEFTIKIDVRRKLLHVLPGALIIVIQAISFILQNLQGFYAGFGINRAAFAVFGETVIAFVFVFMFQYADLLRLQSYQQLPNWAKKWFFSSLKKTEIKSFISSCAFVLTLTPFLFAPMPVFVSVAFVSSLADAAASLVGRKYGRRNFPHGSSKTEAGYMAGTAVAFGIVIFFSNVFNYTHIASSVIFYMAVAAAITIFLIDVFTNTIWDNVLNPLLSGAGMLLVLFFL
jgi:dolichol kinase